MKRSMLIGIAGGALALALAGGAVYAGPRLVAAPAAAAQGTAVPTAQPNAPRRGPAARVAKAANLARGLIKATADATNTKVKDVMTALQGGQSLAQYAQAHGSSDTAIVSATRAKLADRLKQAVANGTIAQAQADARLKAFDAAAPKVMADTKLGDQLSNLRQHRRRFGAALVKATADVTGTAPKDVTAALRSGQSLAQYAQAHGKTADDIIAKLREQGEAQLAKMLEKAKDLIEKPWPGRGGKPGAAPTAGASQ
jgi:hypothetical protein